MSLLYVLSFCCTDPSCYYSKISHSLHDQDTHMKIHTVCHFWGAVYPVGFTRCVLDRSSMCTEGNACVCVHAIHVCGCASVLVIPHDWFHSRAMTVSWHLTMSFRAEGFTLLFHSPVNTCPFLFRTVLLLCPHTQRWGHGLGVHKFPPSKEARCSQGSSALYVSEPVHTSATVQKVQREFPRQSGNGMTFGHQGPSFTDAEMWKPLL